MVFVAHVNEFTLAKYNVIFMHRSAFVITELHYTPRYSAEMTYASFRHCEQTGLLFKMNGRSEEVS